MTILMSASDRHRTHRHPARPRRRTRRLGRWLIALCAVGGMAAMLVSDGPADGDDRRGHVLGPAGVARVRRPASRVPRRGDAVVVRALRRRLGHPGARSRDHRRRRRPVAGLRGPPRPDGGEHDRRRVGAGRGAPHDPRSGPPPGARRRAGRVGLDPRFHRPAARLRGPRGCRPAGLLPVRRRARRAMHAKRKSSTSPCTPRPRTSATTSATWLRTTPPSDTAPTASWSWPTTGTGRSARRGRSRRPGGSTTCSTTPRRWFRRRSWRSGSACTATTGAVGRVATSAGARRISSPPRRVPRRT